MSTSSDSCSDYHHKLRSSKLLPVFEELQAVGFPVSVLERNLKKLKLGNASICFAVYTHLYRAFREIFLENDRALDQYLLNDQVIDRESFAADFFSALRAIIKHEQALPLYQYICPGHPLTKIEEICEISRKLRLFGRQSQPVDTDENSRKTDDRPLPRPDPSSFRNARRPAATQEIRPARIESPFNVPWRAVRETGELAGVLDGDDEGDLSTSGDDEGIRSCNASSIKKALADFAVPEKTAKGHLKRNPTTADVMDSEHGMRTVLNRFEQIESQQNSRFRSIEEHLIRLERGLSDNNLTLHRSVIERLDSHDTRISSLEEKSTTQTGARRSIHNHSMVGEGATPQGNRSPVEGSSQKNIPDLEQRRRSRLQSGTGSRLLTGTNGREEKGLEDSGFSSTHPPHQRESPQEEKVLGVFDSNGYSGGFSNYFESGSVVVGEREARGSRKGSHVTQQAQRNSRSHSVAPANCLETGSGSVAPSRPNDDMALLDLNERIQLRLKERIKTAEDTLNACMEIIRKDYVLIRRHN